MTSADARALLDRVCGLLSRSNDPLATVCLAAIDTGEVVVRLYDRHADAAQLAEIYETRWRLQQEVTGARVEGYERIVPALIGSTGRVELGSITTPEETFIFFVQGEGLVGILRAPYSTLAQKAKLEGIWKTQGLTVNRSVRFIAGAPASKA
ncbi:MAG: hypothetical protein AAGI52_06340 [Bacteroidota bacterium]